MVAKFKGYLLSFIAGIVLLIAFYLKGKSSGKQEAELASSKEKIDGFDKNIKQVEKANVINKEVSIATPSHVDNELHNRFTRD